MRNIFRKATALFIILALLVSSVPLALAKDYDAKSWSTSSTFLVQQNEKRSLVTGSSHNRAVLTMLVLLDLSFSATYNLDDDSYIGMSEIFQDMGNNLAVKESYVWESDGNVFVAFPLAANDTYCRVEVVYGSDKKATGTMFVEYGWTGSLPSNKKTPDKNEIIKELNDYGETLGCDTFYKDGASKDMIQSVQETLNASGCDCGTPDGLVGKKTHSAIRQYRANYGLQDADYIDDELLIAMGLKAGTVTTTTTEDTDVIAGELGNFLGDFSEETSEPAPEPTSTPEPAPASSISSDVTQISKDALSRQFTIDGHTFTLGETTIQQVYDTLGWWVEPEITDMSYGAPGTKEVKIIPYEDTFSSISFEVLKDEWETDGLNSRVYSVNIWWSYSSYDKIIPFTVDYMGITGGLPFEEMLVRTAQWEASGDKEDSSCYAYLSDIPADDGSGYIDVSCHRMGVDTLSLDLEYTPNMDASGVEPLAFDILPTAFTIDGVRLEIGHATFADVKAAITTCGTPEFYEDDGHGTSTLVYTNSNYDFNFEFDAPAEEWQAKGDDAVIMSVSLSTSSEEHSFEYAGVPSDTHPDIADVLFSEVGTKDRYNYWYVENLPADDGIGTISFHGSYEGNRDRNYKYCYCYLYYYVNTEAEAAEPEAAEGAVCPGCGATGVTTAFCPSCGTKMPEPEANWTCPSCGQTDLDTAFCPNCGTKRPEA